MNFPERIDYFLSRQPSTHPTAFVAPGATVVGAVTLGEEASVWFNATVRADINAIAVGPRTNIQDGAVIHVADAYAAEIGELVTVGHQAVVHACTVDNEVLVGMGAIILDGAEIGARSIIGAGALVTGGKKIPPGSLVLGSPATVVRSLSLEEQNSIKVWAERYVTLSRVYLAQMEADLSKDRNR
ncbi:MAG TPA: gamma carbonic anhydrase family protein [Abditibacteriaceae bacterium]|jgi:carbonic anhydrase/acetyltransferase-like protein (isoleucine patch superfamily)